MPPNLRLNESALAILFFAASSLTAQVAVQSGKQIQISAPETTSAVSLDLHIAQISVENGLLTIHGVDPGDTVIFALTQSDWRPLPVHVFPGPPMYPPGFIPPQEAAPQSGSYEFRFNSDRLQFENIIDLSSRNADETTQLHVVTATFAQEPGHDFFVPSAYYRYATPEGEITLLDQTVNESPLTLQNVAVRGLHVKKDAWTFHAGYTTSTDFANVFVPTEKEFAAGISHTTFLGNHLSATPGLYFLRSIDLQDGQQRSAFIASMLFKVDLSSWQAKAELADGRGLAYAAELQHNTVATKLNARFMDRKLDFPSLRTSSLPGISGDASWTELFSQRVSFFSGASVNNVDLNTIRQNTQNAFANLRYNFSQSWSVGTGASYGSFATEGAFSAKTLSLPQSINFDRARFGAGFQYQFSTASDSFSNGSGFRQTLRVNAGRFQIGEYVDWQKDAISVNALFAQLPTLQQELERVGLTSVTPDQIAVLLQEAAFLRLLGLSSTPQIVTVPRRWQSGGSLTWSSNGVHPHQFSVSLLADHNQFIAYNSRDYSLTGAYTKTVSTNNQVLLTWSIVDSNITGRDLLSPLISASFRHNFAPKPAFWKSQEGNVISGIVFIDSTRQGSYRAGMEIVPRAVIVLDGVRSAFTDAGGHFRFSAVSAGSHRLELRYNPERDHYYTSPREVVVAADATVDFGVAFPKTDLWGYVEDDAGNGLSNIKVQVLAGAEAIVIITDESGKFVLPDVEPGQYKLEVSPESVALGYSTEDLAPAEVNVTTGSVAHPVLKIPAMRVLTGTVTLYDAAVGNYLPVKDATVSIPALHRSAVTNVSGQFTFIGLPSGDIEVKLLAGASSTTRVITLPAHPVTLHSVFRISSLTGQVASTLASASQ
jgi:hypothetical protein